ncbi:unnamed protein product [Bursaphelenchus xylophilus]|uniref:(pine wood nematode) hypothetical protein n=1 Tax=Bursaphelenchus xylophilus TaxID=6326 RepID=A0A1I7S538_BURXY|nr:unnamed protein product [Bursaphelenchus xylophilus]CAG9117667.1 unnamed protein product [Bursaphelenchus xylophilus]
MSQVGGPRIKLNSGQEIPLVGLGTFNVADVDKAVDVALKTGYRHFDTAKLYQNEAQLGDALQKYLPKYGVKREQIFLTTKFFLGPEKNTQRTKELVEESLRDLRTEYLDLVLIHFPRALEKENDDPTNADDRKEMWLALKEYNEKGIIKSIGVSNYEVRHLEEIPKYSSTLPAVIQLEFHPHFRRQEIRDYCKKHGIFFQAFSSLGRYSPNLINDPTVVATAKKNKTSVEQVLLSYATSQGIGIVPKSSTPERIVANFKVVDFKLPSEDIQHLNEIDVNQNYIVRCTGWLVK